MRGGNLQAMSRHADTAYQTLLFRLDGRLDHAAGTERLVPLDGVGEIVKLP